MHDIISDWSLDLKYRRPPPGPYRPRFCIVLRLLIDQVTQHLTSPVSKTASPASQPQARRATNRLANKANYQAFYSPQKQTFYLYAVIMLSLPTKTAPSHNSPSAVRHYRVLSATMSCKGIHSFTVPLTIRQLHCSQLDQASSSMQRFPHRTDQNPVAKRDIDLHFSTSNHSKLHKGTRGRGSSDAVAACNYTRCAQPADVILQVQLLSSTRQL